MNLRADILIAALLACRVASGIDAQYCPPQGCPPGFGPQPYQQQYNLPPINVSPSQAILDSVVRVHAGSYAGSGTVVAVENGHALVISCNHIFADGIQNLAIGFRGSNARVPASLVDRDQQNDLSAFDVKLPQNLTPVIVANAEATPMEVCTSVGWGGGNLAYFNGRWNGVYGNTQEIAGSVRPGDSGGPILNSQWQLTGTIIGTDSIQRSTIITASRCQPLRDFIDRVKAKWSAAWAPPLAPIPAKPGDVAPKPTTPPDSKIGDIAEAAGSWGIGAGLAFLGVGGIPAAVVWWLGRRALHKGIAKLEAKHAERAVATSTVQPATQPPPIPVIYQGPICRWQEPQPTAQTAAQARAFEPAIPQPVAVDERYRNLFSYVPDNAGERARAQAVQLYVDRFPGAKVHMENVQKIQDQILKGEPAAA